MQCAVWILLVAAGVLVMASIVRWFEQVSEAVEQHQWSKVFVLIIIPPAVWLFPSRIAAGRPSAVPRHEPVRGFGSVSLTPKKTAPPDAPPPGTPKEFLGPPKIPPKKPSSKSAIDPEKLAKLRQKMKEQGMIDED